MNLSELRDMTKLEINNKLNELCEKKFKLSFKNKISPLKNSMELKNIKKDIARINTIIIEKFND